jgi:S-DNA-T family DNA segregation ATPase FtsK/SpoIIIE
MTFPLGSLRADGTYARAESAPGNPAPDASRPRLRGLWLVVAGAAWLLLVLALLSYSTADPGFSTSGQGGALHNMAGRAGAWASDLAYFVFGFSVWWLVLVAAREWLAALARQLRGDAAAAAPTGSERLAFWFGLILLIAASAALEWTRLYRWEAHLPGHAGGIVGHVLGPL